MGFSHAMGALMIFAGIVLATHTLSSTTRSGYDDVSESYDEMVDTSVDRLHTSIRVDHVYYNKTSNELVLVSYNDGEVVIDCDRLSLVGDGEIGSSDVKFTMYDWNNYSRIFSAEEGYVAFSDDDDDIHIHFTERGTYNRFVTELFTIQEGIESFCANDGFYMVGNTTQPFYLYRYHFNGELAWRLDITADFAPQGPSSVEAEGTEIYVGAAGFVNAYDLNGNYLRTYAVGGLKPSCMCVANGQLYVLSGDVEIFDLQTTAHVGSLDENVSKPLAVDADINGNIYILDAGGGQVLGHIDVFDSNNNYVTAIAPDMEEAIWLTVTRYLGEDVIFVLLEKGDKKILEGMIRVYSLTGTLYDTIHIDEVYKDTPGFYSQIEDAGAIFVLSEENMLVIELKIGYQLKLTTWHGVEFLVIG